MKKWYSIQAKAKASGQSASAEVFIYGDIGESWWGESVIAADLVKELAALDVETLMIRINSYGGSVTDGMAIYNAIKRHKATTTVSIDGAAYSVASLIAMAGDTVEMAENGLMMIHAPWSGVLGNSAAMRQEADVLDMHAQAMASSYARKSGKTHDEILSMLTDGVDHWMTASEAQAQGFVDAVTPALAIAASFDRAAWAARAHVLGNATSTTSIQPASRSISPAAAAAPTPEKDTTMPDKTPQAAGQQPAAPDESEIKAAIEKATKDESERRDAIEAAFAKYLATPGMTEVLAACKKDTACTLEQAKIKILDKLGEGGSPLPAGYATTLEDETDKLRAAAVTAIMCRAGVEKDAKVRAALSGNPFRGAKLLDMAKDSLARAGFSTRGKSQMEIVAAAFTQSTSDFPVILENAMHKTLQASYAAAALTWKRFCAVGTVGDFRAHNRYRVGSFGNLDALTELGEFKNKTVPDGEKATITAGTKGNIINLSRQVVINDDLGAFIGLANSLGPAAARTIEADVYTTLALNSGLGPTMGDGYTLFHANHGNITTGAAIAMAALDLDRVAMASQKDVSGNDYLDLRPAVLLLPIALGGTARSINEAAYDPDTANKLQKPNMVKGLFSDIVDSPRVTGTRRYLFADPAIAPVLEVAFLDGMEEPYLEAQNGWDVDGVQQKVRLDFGIGAVDYRGAVTNAGQ